MADVELPAATKRACTSCGYDLTGAASGTCPECGYTPTAEEIALGERRAVFVELTRWRQWAVYLWPLAPYVLMYLMVRRGPWPIVLIGAILMLGVIAWAEVAGRLYLNVPRGQRRAARAVWRLGTKWLVLPFWGSGIVIIVLVIFNDFLFAWSPYSDRFERIMFRAPVVTAAIAYAASWPLWRWSWRRLARTAGLTGELQGGAGVAEVARKVMWAVGVILALPVLSIILELLLDTLRPEWWR